jgi:hypothetical protein
LKVDRHTIERAVLNHFGKRFKELKVAIQDDAIAAALAVDDVISIKQAATKVGYGSAASLANGERILRAEFSPRNGMSCINRFAGDEYR